jgi:PTH1 family peptidyl-tRNA hydrolase
MLVGLGNPGKDYAKTRHNIGFIFLDYLAEKFNLAFKQSRWQAETIKETLWGRQVILLKPLTFMNRSGQAVGEACRYHQIEPSEVLVIHDDLDLDLGKIKLVTNRGTGGHNGIRSIVEHLGTNDFMRIRVGIGRPQLKEDVSNYVLNRFASEEHALVHQSLENIEEAVQLVFAKGALAAMTAVNR